MAVGLGVGVRRVSVGGFIVAVADGVGSRLGVGVGGGAWVAIGIVGAGVGMGVGVSPPSPPQATVIIMDAARMASGKKGFIGVVLVSASYVFFYAIPMGVFRHFGTVALLPLVAAFGDVWVTFRRCPASTPIALTSILSQDGRGGKRGGNDGYAKVSIISIKGEGIREDGLPPTREKGRTRGKR